MARYAQIESKIWEEFRGYKTDAKLLYIFLFSCAQCKSSGLFKITLGIMISNTGLTEKNIITLLKELKSKITYDYNHSVIFIHGKLKRSIRDISKLKNNKNLLTSVKRDIEINKESILCISKFIQKYRGILKSLIKLPEIKEGDNIPEQPKEPVQLTARSPESKFKPEAIEVLHYLNLKSKKSYREVETNLKWIIKRMKEEATVEDCKIVIDSKIEHWLYDEEQNRYLRPETLFGNKFWGYLGDGKGKITQQTKRDNYLKELDNKEEPKTEVEVPISTEEIVEIRKQKNEFLDTLKKLSAKKDMNTFTGEKK